MTRNNISLQFIKHVQYSVSSNPGQSWRTTFAFVKERRSPVRGRGSSQSWEDLKMFFVKVQDLQRNVSVHLTLSTKSNSFTVCISLQPR